MLLRPTLTFNTSRHALARALLDLTRSMDALGQPFAVLPEFVVDDDGSGGGRPRASKGGRPSVSSVAKVRGFFVLHLLLCRSGRHGGCLTVQVPSPPAATTEGREAAAAQAAGARRREAAAGRSVARGGSLATTHRSPLGPSTGDGADKEGDEACGEAIVPGAPFSTLLEPRHASKYQRKKEEDARRQPIARQDTNDQELLVGGGSNSVEWNSDSTDCGPRRFIITAENCSIRPAADEIVKVGNHRIAMRLLLCPF